MKTCGVCLNEFPTMWKAKTKTEPQMCRTCALKSKGTKVGNYTMIKISDVARDLVKEQKITSKSSDIKPVEKRTPKEDKSIPELIKLATIVFNKWIRKRDTINGKSFVCISCHRIKSVDVMQAGHYLSAGSNSSIRFNDWNVNGQCIECNCMKEGNQKEYRVGLVEKIGEVAVEALEESANLPYKWDREFLLDIIKKYK